MPSTTFVDYTTPIVASWLNDANTGIYGGTIGQVWLSSGGSLIGAWTAQSTLSVGNSAQLGGVAAASYAQLAGNNTWSGTNSYSQVITSTVATGTAPFTVASTTPVANLSIGGNAATATSAVNLTGTIASGVTATTQIAGDNSTKVATTAYADRTARPDIQSISASVATNALTVTYNGGTLDFRNGTLTTGTTTVLAVGSLSITVPSTATLGTVNATSARLVVLVAYNVGTPVLCIVNLSGGNQLDETNLISPTTISAAATANNVIYSASTVSASSPYRVVGFVDITEATAGTWATAPTQVQGVGGQALTSLSSLGYGQTFQTPTRALATTYYNTTGKPIFIYVSLQGVGSNSSSLTISINGGAAMAFGYNGPGGAFGAAAEGYMIIPPGASYNVTATNGTLSHWNELR